MGAKGGGPVVGYEYSLGMHMVLCHSPIDAVTKILVDDRNVPIDGDTPGQIEVSKRKLFGNTEGGIAGTIDIESGAPDQTQNDYLLDKIGSGVPAYRGVVSAILRRVYIGNNPYLKPWAWQVQRILKRIVNDEIVDQWLPELAPIGAVLDPLPSTAVTVQTLSGGSAGRRYVWEASDTVWDMQETTDTLIRRSLTTGLTVATYASSAHKITSGFAGTDPWGNLIGYRASGNTRTAYRVDPTTFEDIVGYQPFQTPALGSTSSTIINSVGYTLYAALLGADYRLIDWTNGVTHSFSLDGGYDDGNYCPSPRGYYMVEPVGTTEFRLYELRLPPHNSTGDYEIEHMLSWGGSIGAISVAAVFTDPSDGSAVVAYYDNTNSANRGFKKVKWVDAADPSSGVTTVWTLLRPDATELSAVGSGYLRNALTQHLRPRNGFFYYAARTDNVGIFSASTGELVGFISSPAIQANEGSYQAPNGHIWFGYGFNGFAKMSFDLPPWEGDIYDINPAHIIRECLTNAEWGRGLPEADMGDSFAVAAQTLWDEEFGLSLAWGKSTSIEDFIKVVLNHIDAILYVDRQTGKWELKLVRDDYDYDTILELDESYVAEYAEVTRRTEQDQINSITVQFYDRDKEAGASRTVTDIASVQRLGETISTTVQYPGITREALAARVAMRDLRSLSSNLITGRIVCRRLPEDFNVGSVFKAYSPRHGLNGEAMRVVSLSIGDGRRNRITIHFAQDVFSLGDAVLVAGGDSETEPLSAPPAVPPVRLVWETPYFELVRASALQSDVDTRLDLNPDSGTLSATASYANPSDLQWSADVRDAPAAEWDELVFGSSFAPAGLLVADLGRDPLTDTAPVLTSVQDDEDFDVGTLAVIGDEIVRIDGWDSGTGVLTIGRGCLDTIPQEHPAGTPIIMYQDNLGSDQIERVLGDDVGIRIRTVTLQGTLDSEFAATDRVLFNARAIRPYPPGNLTADGDHFWDEPRPNTGDSGGIVFAWNHRDRLAQVSPTVIDYTDGNVGPEDGTTYELRAWELDEDFEVIGSGPYYTDNVGTALTASFDLSANPVSDPDTVVYVLLEIVSVRDGYDCWQNAGYILEVGFLPPADFTVELE